MTEPRTTCLVCGDELWGHAERHGVCSRCQRDEADEREERDDDPREVDLTGYDLDDYDGMCLELVDDLLHAHPSGSILYVEPAGGPWRYHAALVLDGLVYDAWHPDVRVAPAEYVRKVFGDGTPWEVNPGAADDAVACEVPRC